MTDATITKRKDFLSVLDFDPAELESCLQLAAQVKSESFPRTPCANLRRARRTPRRDAVRQAVLAYADDVRDCDPRARRPPRGVAGRCRARRREPVADVARTLERWIDAVVIRTFSQDVLQDFAAAPSGLHVVNALTAQEHPCQAIADFLTLQERFGQLRGRTIAYVGDGNNVATSLAHAAAMLGVHLHIASPEPYQLPHAVVQQATGGGAPRRAPPAVQRCR
jgi:ornithine carbamoyltransferase